jgi:hypothetical protein
VRAEERRRDQRRAELALRQVDEEQVDEPRARAVRGERGPSAERAAAEYAELCERGERRGEDEPRPRLSGGQRPAGRGARQVSRAA